MNPPVIESAFTLLARKAWAKVQLDGATPENHTERLAAYRKADRDVKQMDKAEIAAGNPEWTEK